MPRLLKVGDRFAPMAATRTLPHPIRNHRRAAARHRRTTGGTAILAVEEGLPAGGTPHRFWGSFTGASGNLFASWTHLSLTRHPLPGFTPGARPTRTFPVTRPYTRTNDITFTEAFRKHHLPIRSMTVHRFSSVPACGRGTRGRPSTGLRRLLPACCAVLLPFGGGFAAAQTIPSAYRPIENRQAASFFGGYMLLPTGSLDLGPKSGSFVGGRYAIEAGGPIFFEGLLSYLPTMRNVVDPRRQLGDRSIGEADVHLVMLDTRLSFSLTGQRTWNHLTPHLFVGAGVAYDAGRGNQVEEVLLPEDVFRFGTAFTANAGIGVRFLMGDRIMAIADTSLKLWQIGTPTGFDDPAKRPDDETDPLHAPEESEWVGGYGFSLSLAWRF